MGDTQSTSLDPAKRRLAVHVEDHPLEYGKFEGTIPKGHYGTGNVKIWDRGVWIPQDNPRTALRQGKLKFQLRGTKLSGGWSLIRRKIPYATSAVKLFGL